MNRTMVIFWQDGEETTFKVIHIYNPDIWDAYSVLHFKTKEGKSYSVRTDDIERIEIEEE